MRLLEVPHERAAIPRRQGTFDDVTFSAPAPGRYRVEVRAGVLTPDLSASYVLEVRSGP